MDLTHDDDTADRQAFLEGFVRLHPEVRDDTPEGTAAAIALVNLLGELTAEEVALVLGVSRQRIDQITASALSKARAAGGSDLREAHEHDPAERVEWFDGDW